MFNILQLKGMIIVCVVSCFCTGCDEIETSQSSQAEAAFQLRRKGVSVLTDDNSIVWSLIIHQTTLESEDFKYIRAFPKLKYLSLSKSSIEDEGMKYLSGLINLEKIYISKTKITDKGVKSLKGLDHLMILDLSNTLITDDCLIHLGKLPLMEHLKIEDTAVTDEGVELFKKKHPKCTVYR